MIPQEQFYTNLFYFNTVILAGKLILPFEGKAACHYVVQRHYAYGNHSGEAERCYGIGLKLLGFVPEPVLTFIPESCSSSSWNTVRNHPGIAFTLPRIPHSCSAAERGGRNKGQRAGPWNGFLSDPFNDFWASTRGIEAPTAIAP